MIDVIRVKNFKSLMDSGELELKPITILIGPNSGGKSTFIQFLLLLKQTSESGFIDTPLVLNGEYINLGSFIDVIHKHRVRKFLEFEFNVDLGSYSGPLPYTLQRLSKITKGSKIRYRAKIKYVKPRIKNVAPRLRLEEFEVSLKRRDHIKYAIEFKFDSKNQRYDLFVNNERVDNIPKKFRDQMKQVRFYITTFPSFDFGRILAQQRPWFSKDELRLLELLLESTRYIDFWILRNIYYIGPLREYPKRYYLLSGNMPPSVGIRGENTISTILASKKQEELLEKINQWLVRFGIANEFQIKEIKHQILAEALVEDPYQNIVVNITDVGFGLSQLLPIIVEGFHAPQDSIILIEQPEIHLHPKVQAEIADLFIDISKSGNKKLVVETHSEHIILRLQRRIIEGDFDNRDIVIYYFEPTPDGTVIKKISINELGELENWPKGFFEEDIEEIMSITKARLNKLREIK